LSETAKKCKAEGVNPAEVCNDWLDLCKKAGINPNTLEDIKK